LSVTRSRSADIDHVLDAGTLQATLERIARAVGGLHPITRASVRIIDPEDPDNFILAGVWSSGPTNLTPGTRIPVRSTSFRDAWRHGGATLLEMSELDRPPTLLDDILRNEGVQSWVTLPLRDDDLLVGLLSLSSPDPGSFTKDSRVLFETIRESCEARLIELAQRQIEVLKSKDRNPGGW
jgi:GAF domain-containing protein